MPVQKVTLLPGGILPNLRDLFEQEGEMNLRVIKEEMSDYLDIHGGECAVTKTEIYVDKNLHPRVQRNLVIHAVVESFCRSWDHDKVEELTELITEALDQLESE
jgi:O-acetyl-ADP-ribose deacetylase (regulator of RNase III)